MCRSGQPALKLPFKAKQLYYPRYNELSACYLSCVLSAIYHKTRGSH